MTHIIFVFTFISARKTINFDFNWNWLEQLIKWVRFKVFFFLFPKNFLSYRVTMWPFLKQFSRNKSIWPFGLFLAFFQSWRKWYLFRPILVKFQQNIQHFMIFQKHWYILINFLWEFGLFWNCLWPNFAFFYFSGPGNSVILTLSSFLFESQSLSLSFVSTFKYNLHEWITSEIDGAKSNKLVKFIVHNEYKYCWSPLSLKSR